MRKCWLALAAEGYGNLFAEFFLNKVPESSWLELRKLAHSLRDKVLCCTFMEAFLFVLSLDLINVCVRFRKLENELNLNEL